MTIKQINSEGLSDALTLIHSYKQSSHFKTFGEGFGLDWSDDQIIAELGSGLCFGCFNDGVLTSLILGRDVNGSIYEIDLTMTHPDFLRTGLMKKLFSNTVRVLKDQQFEKVWLEVHEENLAAIALYRELGFSEDSRRPRYYPDQKAAILMSLWLQNR